MTDAATAIKALRYWRDECSGQEPSFSVFERMVDAALGDVDDGECLSCVNGECTAGPSCVATELWRNEDDVRAALLFVLWHHQGGSSVVGQSIRLQLGMGEYESLNAEQLAAAKRAESALRRSNVMIIEVVFEGNPKKQECNKRASLGMLMSMYAPIIPPATWIATAHDGTVLNPEKPIGDQVADGQRIYISRQAGTAA